MKPIELPKPKVKEVIPEEKELYELLDKYGIKHETKYHSIISTIDQFEDLEQKINGTICIVNMPEDSVLLRHQSYPNWSTYRE